MQELDRFCQILGLEAGASKAEVKQAYRDLVHVWHPDRFTQNPRLQKKAEARLKEINAAYEQLLASPRPAAAPAKPKKQQSPPPSPPPRPREKRESASRPRGKQTSRSPRQAILAMKRAIRQDPENAGAHYNLGTALLHLGRDQEALESFQKVVSLEPRSAAAHVGRGVALNRLGKGHQAVAAFRKALTLKPDDPLTYLNLGIAYRRLGRHQLGCHAVLQAIRLEPDYPEAHYELGLSSLCRQNRASALDEYKILLRLDGNLAHKLFDLIYREFI
jgi:Flp pilus assembly protein TadD